MRLKGEYFDMDEKRGKIRCKDCGEDAELIDIYPDNKKGTIAANYKCDCDNPKKSIIRGG